MKLTKNKLQKLINEVLSEGYNADELDKAIDALTLASGHISNAMVSMKNQGNDSGASLSRALHVIDSLKRKLSTNSFSEDDYEEEALGRLRAQKDYEE